MMSSSRAGDRSGSGHRKARVAKGHRRGGQGAPCGDQIVDDHHPDRPGRSDPLGPGDELARGSTPTLGGGELDGIRPPCRQGQDRRDSGSDATSTQDAGRMPGQPLDVLAATAAGHRVSGRDRDEPRRPGPQLRDGHGQRDGQWGRQVTATPLLVGKQARPRNPRVLGGHRDRRQPHRHRIGMVPPRSGERLPAPLADGPAGGRAGGAPAR
jgi:hypothetical protein